MNACESPHSTMVFDPVLSPKTHLAGLSVTPVVLHFASEGVPTVAMSFDASASDGLRFDGSVVIDRELATSDATCEALPGPVDAPDAVMPSMTVAPASSVAAIARQDLTSITCPP